MAFVIDTLSGRLLAGQCFGACRIVMANAMISLDFLLVVTLPLNTF